MHLNEVMQNCVTVIGLGRIGCGTAGCLEGTGRRIWGVDSNPARVASVAAGHPPFHENLLQSPSETLNKIRASGLPILDLASSSVFTPRLMGALA